MATRYIPRKPSNQAIWDALGRFQIDIVDRHRIHLPYLDTMDDEEYQRTQFNVFFDLFSDVVQQGKLPVWIYWMPESDTEAAFGDPEWWEPGDRVQVGDMWYRVEEIDTSFRVKTFAILSPNV